jgi:hypothetical protein
MLDTTIAEKNINSSREGSKSKDHAVETQYEKGY